MLLSRHCIFRWLFRDENDIINGQTIITEFPEETILIKLIASDLDGTLLPEATTNLNPELFTVIRELKKRGITFAAATGRQYLSAKSLLAPVEDDILILADNGSCIMEKGQALQCRTFDKQTFAELVRYVRTLDHVCVLVSSLTAAYTDSRNEWFCKELLGGYQVKLQIVDDVLEIEDSMIKVAAYFLEDDAAKMAASCAEQFSERAHIMASGAHWVDFMAKDVDKGAALKKVQQMLHVTKEETMAFGDNQNDIGMLLEATESYAVATARDEVKAVARYVLPDEKDSVLNVLRKLCKN